MNREDVYTIWAPPQSPWSPWVKPVLFAHVRGHAIERTGPDPPPAPTWAPPADGATAIVIDLPGPHGVWLALALADGGYRPVPLYNACPSPVVPAAVPATDVAVADPQPRLRSTVAVDVWAIIDAIERCTWKLASGAPAADAPPAFLLDAERRVGSRTFAATPGAFDNRSVSLPTDFPSGNLLLSRGVRRILLVQQDSVVPQEDLAHTLLRWQQAGLGVEALVVNAPAPHPVAITVQPPSLFRRAWHRALATLGLKRHPLGGFGGHLPQPSSG